MAHLEVGGYFLPRLIRFARGRAGLSQRDVASRCDVVQPSVVAWESGRRAINEESLSKVAAALGYPDVEAFLDTELAEWTRAKAPPPTSPQEDQAHENT